MSSLLNRKLSVVFFSDIVGYTKLMGRNEDKAFELITQNLEIHSEVLAKYNGQIIKELGDGILATFDTAKEALNASIEIQKEWIEKGDIQIRIGLHCGEIIYDHGDVFGDAVNVAARIQGIGIPSCIIFSEKILKTLPKNSNFTFNELGVFDLKNVEKDIELYALTNSPCSAPHRKDLIKNIRSQEKSVWKFWVGLATTILIILFLIYSLVWNGYAWEKDKSVAVLPFINIDAKNSQDVYSKDITYEIISQLSEINDIKVISYRAIENISNPNLNLDSLAKVLDVSTILKGSIQYFDEMTKVNVQLIDVEEDKNLWTESFTRGGEDLLLVQGVIAKEISRVLGISLTAKEEAEIGKVITSSPEAYDWYLKAKEEYSKYNIEGYQLAVEYFKKAKEIDPNFTLAYAGLADTYSQLSFFDSSNNVSEIGLLIDPNSAELYKTRGNTQYYLGQLDLSKKSFELATTIKPNYSEAIGNLATINFSQGNLKESLEGELKSATLNPNNPLPFQMAGWIYRILGNSKEAILWLEKANTISQVPNTYSLMATVYINDNNIEEAKKLIPKTLTDNPNYTNYESAGLISFFSKDFPNARNYYENSIMANENFREDPYFIVPINYAFLLYQEKENEIADSLVNNSISIRESLVKNGSKDNNTFFELASAEAARNHNDEAIEYLNQAYELGWRDLFFIEYNPIFSHLQAIPEYKIIIDKIQAAIDKENKSLNVASLERSR